MAVDSTEVLMGPCDVYVGAYGATEPTLGDWSTAIDTSIWVPAGATSGGVKLSASIDSKTIEVDQVMEELGVRITGRKVACETELSQITLENIKSLMNSGTITSGGSTVGSAWTIDATTDVFTSGTAHTLAVGDRVVLGTITTTTGVTAGTTYYVVAVGSSTTMQISATAGGTALNMTSNGSTASVTLLKYKQFEPLSSTEAFAPTYSALLLEGQAPTPATATGWKRRFILRKVLSTGGFEIEQKKDTQQGLKAKWGVFYISDAVKPFKIIDQIHS